MVNKGGSISQYATKWNRTYVLGNTKINYSPNNQKLIEQLTLFHARELVKKGKVSIKKMTSVAIGIETEGFGHVGLIIGFDDDTYEEANFGRYGSNVTRISSTPYASPIGGGTYAFDYNYIPSKDIKRLYFIDVNPNDVAYWYNSTIVNNGYQLINDSIIIRKDRAGKEIVSSASYRNSSNMDYNLFSNNCVTTSLNPILSLTKYNNTIINLLRKVISPPAVENILKNFGKHDKIVKKVINDD